MQHRFEVQRLAWSLLLLSPLATALDGPYSHTSDGVTQPIIVTDAAGNIVYGECVPGSRCANRTASSPLAPGAAQTITFMLRTGNNLGVGSDHFAFGVRGNPTNASCVSNLKSNPFLGRGIALYAGARKVVFENFTSSCFGDAPSATAPSTERSITLQRNTSYLIQITANQQNTWYSIDKYYYNTQDRIWDFLPIASGDCLADAVANDEHVCAKRSQDLASAHRTFVANTRDLQWQVTDWWLE
jgi:hypothetical protein